MCARNAISHNAKTDAAQIPFFYLFPKWIVVALSYSLLLRRLLSLPFSICALLFVAPFLPLAYPLVFPHIFREEERVLSLFTPRSRHLKYERLSTPQNDKQSSLSPSKLLKLIDRQSSGYRNTIAACLYCRSLNHFFRWKCRWYSNGCQSRSGQYIDHFHMKGKRPSIELFSFNFIVRQDSHRPVFPIGNILRHLDGNTWTWNCRDR